MLTHKIDDNISLRLWNIKDVEKLHHLIIESKDHLRKWLPWVDERIKDINYTKEYILKSLDIFVKTGGYPQSVAILYKCEIVGTIGFNAIDEKNKNGIIGYWISEKYQGKGIITKATKALIYMGFKQFKLNRIEIRVADKNTKSKMIPIKLGFKEEGKIRQAEYLYDHYVDLIIYSILADEFYG